MKRVVTRNGASMGRRQSANLLVERSVTVKGDPSYKNLHWVQKTPLKTRSSLL